MSEYLLIAGISFLLSFLLTPVMRIIGLRIGVVDKPDGDMLKIHKQATSLLGGGAILIASIAGLITATLSSLITNYQQLLGVTIGGLLVFGVGLWDDAKGVHPGLRLSIHILSGVIILMMGKLQ